MLYGERRGCSLSEWYRYKFFFFKQKTAYEIKECDWSSDVCSSDLFFTGNINELSFEDIINSDKVSELRKSCRDRRERDRKSVV